MKRITLKHILLVSALIVMLALAACRRPASDGSTANLENTYWKLMRLGDGPAITDTNMREPHFVLTSENRSMHGHTGCNLLSGGYKLSGERLTFPQVITTKMACASGMQEEQGFLEALRRAERWKIAGEQLELFDQDGARLALFESRYLR